MFFKTKTRDFLFALAMFTNTIVGVGIFGLPYIASKAGFGLTIAYLVGFCFIVILMSLSYAEISFRERVPHRFPGYAEHYFGKKMKHFAFTVETVAVVGALVSYIIVGGNFLNGLLHQLALPGGSFWFSVLFFVLGAFLVFMGIKTIERTELLMLGILLLLVLGFLIVGFGKVELTNLQSVDWHHFFLPYGITIFALWGIPAIPELKEIIKHDNKKIKQVLVWGLIIATAIYALFVYLISGISGGSTTSDSLAGLVPHFSPSIMLFAYLFGFLATFTSYIVLSFHIKKTFQYDYKVKPVLSWFLACFVPFIVFVLGVTNFIEVMNFVGSLGLGLFGILLFMMFLKIKERTYKFFPFSHYWAYLLIVIFVAGILLEIGHLLHLI